MVRVLPNEMRKCVIRCNIELWWVVAAFEWLLASGLRLVVKAVGK